VLDHLFEIANELNAMRNLFKVQKVGILLDSSIRDRF
jgi:hypothetical protein